MNIVLRPTPYAPNTQWTTCSPTPSLQNTMGIVQTQNVSITQAEHTLCLGAGEITVGYVGQVMHKDHGNRLEHGYGSSIPVTYWSQHDTLCVQDVYTHSAEAVVPYAEPAVNCSWQAGLTQSQGRRPQLHTQTMQILWYKAGKGLSVKWEMLRRVRSHELNKRNTVNLLFSMAY